MQHRFAFAGRSLVVRALDHDVDHVLQAAYGPLRSDGPQAQHSAAASCDALVLDGASVPFAYARHEDRFVRAYHCTQELFARFAAHAADGAALYGASVAVNDRAVLILGNTGAGKTTLALSLAQFGARFLGDESLIVNDCEMISALARRPMIRESALPLLPAKLVGEIVTSPHVYGANGSRWWYALEPESLAGIGPDSTPYRLSAVLVLDRAGGHRAIEEIDSEHLLPICASRLYGGARDVRVLARLRRLLRGVRGFMVALQHPREISERVVEQVAS